jgi:peptide/nickel transport system substrate-binding protein
MMQVDTIRIVQEQVRLNDPHAITDSRTLLNLRDALHDALVRRTPTGAFEPSLAMEWSTEPDARNWTFSIRHGARFHDGRPVRATDVAASILRAASPAAGGEMATEGVLAGYFEGARVTAPSPDRVRITMGRPVADLLDLLADIVILPDGEPTGDATVGAGPYRISEIHDGGLVMEAVEHYWRGDPLANKLVWLAEPDAAERARLVREQAVDLAIGLGIVAQHTLARAETVTVLTSPGSLCVAFLLNATNGPCADPRVRQALNYALDVDSIIAEVAGGAAQALNGPFTPLHYGHAPDVPRYPHDPDRARALLAEAGYRDGLTLTFDIPTRLPDEALALGEALQRDCRAIGVEVQLQVHTDRLAYARMVRAKQIGDGCCFDSSPLSTYRVLREKLHSRVAGPWWQGYANNEVDALIDVAATTLDDAERQAIYRRAYRTIRDDAPWIFLYSPLLVDGAGPRLAGWQPAINGLARFA